MRLFAILVLCCWCIGPLTAQVKFTTLVNETTIGKNEYVQVQYVIENANAIRDLKPPVFKGFNIVAGPIQQTGMSTINGSLTRYEGIAYTLRPLSVGKHIISGATAIIDNKPMRSNNITVNVINASTNNQPPNGFFEPDEQPELPQMNEDYILKPGENAIQKIKNNLFVKLDVNKTSCYEGQPIIATYKLYSRLKSESRVVRRPSLDGFSVYDMVQPDNYSPAIERLNGKPFNVHIIRKVQLYPLQAGTYVLDPVEVANKVSFVRANASNNSMQGLLDSYMDGEIETHEVILSALPVSITVKPLPLPAKPANYDGAVGAFTISAAVNTLSLAAGETGQLKITINGEGNLPLINAPVINWPKEAEGYESNIKEDIDKTIAPIKGSKIFEYGFTAQKEGVIHIPPVWFSYFDVAANSYRQLKTDSFTVTITKAINKQQAAPTAGAKKSTVYTPWLMALLVVLGGIGLLWLIKKTGRNKPQSLSEKSIAIEVPQPQKDIFAEARKALHANNSNLFYKETGIALWSLFAKKLILTGSALNKQQVIDKLQQKGFTATQLLLVENCLKECEVALYTPVQNTHKMTDLLAQAEMLAQALEKK
jgi:BatD DUF11 like domain